MSAGVEWHGDKAFARCSDCVQLVRVNKPLVGSLHLCVTDCEKAGEHLGLTERNTGRLWWKKVKRRCTACGMEGKRKR